MAKKYLDENGLLYLWQKIKNIFVPKTDAVKTITRSGLTFTATKADGNTFTFDQKGYEGATLNPNMDGIVSVGVSEKYAREDHVHPSDNTKVDKVSGKELSTNDFTNNLKDKLDGIEIGAEVNQNTFAKFKIGATVIEADEKADIVELIAGSNNISITPNSENDTITIDAIGAISGIKGSEESVYRTGQVSISADNVGAVPVTTKGVANGVCPLNSTAKIDASYLPSYVDDIIEVYARTSATPLSSQWFSKESVSGDALIPESGVIYVLIQDTDDYSANTQFRWGGSAYVKMVDGGISAITNAEIDDIVELV